MLKSVGRFIFMSTLLHYNEPAMTATQLTQKLQSDGLHISDIVRTERYLQTIGYFRLKAYMFPFLAIPKIQHKFKNGTSFDNVLMLYRLDKKLRLLIFNEIEKIEVALRCAIVNIISDQLGSIFWMTESQYLASANRFQQSINLIQNELSHSREDFIVQFRKQYSNPFPPSWILAEILPLGILTNIFANLKSASIQKAVAQSFNLSLPLFTSWLTTITLTRNACCHHARVWNKDNSIVPSMPRKTMSGSWVSDIPNISRVYCNLCIIRYMLDAISPNNDMTGKLKQLFADFPEVDIAAMGFPSDWQNEPLWAE